ncbi:hypothetical protein BKA70DRAFT_1567012 [Coprinopsis sp. MPI-PUGE-AT-0042]|nr:hypothetical protein BKA70DRAFT_1567012 [Coprinopsis sp. MPI-PUGE-AT-0042]
MAPTDTDYMTRDNLFSVLQSMKLGLPRTSKMSIDTLSKRLKDGLNASQRTGELIPGDFLDPGQLATWPSLDSEQLGRQIAVMQQSVKAAFDRQLNQGLPRTPEQTFEELQDVVLFVGLQFGAGVSNLVLSDKDLDDWAVVVRVFSVHAANEDTPVFVLSYRIIHSIPKKTLKQQIAEVFTSETTRRATVSELGRRAFLRLLGWNAKLLVPQYQPEGEAQAKYAKKKWKISFAVPLGPIPMEEVGRLTSEAGCDVCGRSSNANSRCTQCLAAVYCSSECQTRDWPSHKDVCTSLQQGTWTEINLGENPSAPMDGLPGGLFVQRMNVHESWQGSSTSNPTRIGGEDGQGPDIPKDIHGKKAFLVKFQVGLGGGRPNHMMMYDRKRSFTVFWKRSGDPDAFKVGEQAMDGELKMFRWAIRTGPRTMKICFDQPPRDTPSW